MTQSKETTLVKSCPKLESGLRLGQEGVLACQLGPFSSPLFWSAEEAAQLKITREMIAEKRKWIFELLNDDHSETSCKHCHMVRMKPASEVRFDRLGHIDLAATSTCNLRCNFCDYTLKNSFAEAKYDALDILRLFSPEDVLWDSAVDFNGGEPTLLKDFDEYIDYFASRRIRVFLYTNAVVYRQSVYDGLAKGTIRWVCASLDAGTPSSYEKIKKSTRFNNVLENITRYSQAGSLGGGQLSVKYIFCQDNSSNDDVTGFSYAMLAIRPQEVWLTFDFEPLHYLPGDQADFGGYDYSPHIEAYAKTYVMLEKHGLRPVHFPEKHLAVVSLQGKLLLQAAKEAIGRLSKKTPAQELRLQDFRVPKQQPFHGHALRIALSPLRVRQPEQEWMPLSLAGKRVVVAPACTRSLQLLQDSGIEGANVVGILDRDTVLSGKEIGGVRVFPYSAVSSLAPDYVIVAAPEHHCEAIARTVAPLLTEGMHVAILEVSN